MSSPASGPDSVLDDRFIVPQHVVHRAFAAETVMLNLGTGKYHGLNPVAGRMLELLTASGDPREVVGRVSEEYGADPAQVERDTAALCRDLLERGLIERAPAA